MQMLAHGAAGVELPQSGGLRSGAAERVLHLIGVEAKQRSGGGRRPESGGGSGGMPEAVVARIHGLPDPQRGPVAERDGQQKRASAGVLPFGDGERGGNDRGGRVQRRAFMHVVVFENMRGASVG